MVTFERVEVLHGHTSPQTAYLVTDYPYGGLRCSMRYWIHTATTGAHSGQQRLMRQSSNPRKPATVWNTPKADTYQLMTLLYRDELGHVQRWGVSEYGVTPQADAVFRLMGLYDQLTADRRRKYDAIVGASRLGDAQPWLEFQATLAALADHLRQTGEIPEITNGVWTAPDKTPRYLGDDRVVAAYLTRARQRLAPDA